MTWHFRAGAGGNDHRGVAPPEAIARSWFAACCRPLVVYHPALSLGGVHGHREASLVWVALKGEEAGVAPVACVCSGALRPPRTWSSFAPKQRLRALLPGLV